MIAKITFLCVLAVSLPGQSDLGSITGKLADPDGHPISGENLFVIATNTSNQAVFKAPITATSDYSLTKLPPGAYAISVPLPCCQYSPYKQSGIRVDAGKVLELNIPIPWGINLGTLGDDPTFIANDMRSRTKESNEPTPRTHNGHPDFSGVWAGVFEANDTDVPPLQPWAMDLLRKRASENLKEIPGGLCLPDGAILTMTHFPYKFVQSDSTIVMMVEFDTPGFRQIFIDGRKHPDPERFNPAWMGHSIGTWDGDTLVVDTVGYNDRSTIHLAPHTEQLHVVERMRRPDKGHLVIDIAADDPGAFTQTFHKTVRATLAAPDEEIMEFVCNENNKDLLHLVGK